MNEVSIFDSLYSFLCFAIEILKNIVYGVRLLPQLIADSFVLVQRYSSVFPTFLYFIILFAFGYGIIRKLTHWGD